MLGTSSLLTVVLLASTRTVSADFDKFFFASNATEYVCPGIGFACTPPMICSHESVTDLYYCCMPGATDGVCWKGSSSCDGEGGKSPSGSQQSCSSGDNAFCCLKSRSVQPEYMILNMLISTVRSVHRPRIKSTSAGRPSITPLRICRIQN